VDWLKRIFLLLFVLVFIFTFNVTALADGEHTDHNSIKESIGKFKSETDKEQQEHRDHNDSHEDVGKEPVGGHTDDGHSKEVNSEDHQPEGNHSEDDHLEGSHSEDNSEGDQEEGSGGHHGPVVETPPNYKILGTYGAVNLSFILIGIWNKWFRRKGNN
jgi:hypothetical protein